jgi:hypothetical protein
MYKYSVIPLFIVPVNLLGYTELDGKTRTTAKRAAWPNSTSTSTPHNCINMSSIQAALAAIALLGPGEEINYTQIAKTHGVV